MTSAIKNLACCLLLLAVTRANAQVNFNITSANITQTSQTVDNASLVYTQPLVVLAPNLFLKSSADGMLSKTGGGTGIAASVFTAKILGTANSLNNVQSSTPTITLSAGAQSVYSSLLALLNSGAINIRYTLANQNTYTWRAGAYTTDLNFSLTGLTNPGTLNNYLGSLNLNVAAFITATSTTNSLQLNINSFNFYRSTSASATYDINTVSTMPYGIRFKNNSATFTYTNGYSGATDPAAATTLMNAQMTSPSTSATVAGGSALNTITTALDVPNKNQQTNTITLGITPANLKTGFKQAGTYTTTLNYEVFDTQTTPGTVIAPLSCPLVVVVSDMGELKVNQTDINLNYNTTTNYINGVFADAAAHITLSKTSPYDVYVKAGSSTLTNGSNTLPVSLITVSPTPATAGAFATVSLTATAQKIISGSLPAIDKSLDVRYAITAANSSQLLGKPAGTYNATVTYSLIPQ